MVAQGARIIVHNSTPSYETKGIQRAHHDAGSAPITEITINQEVRASTGRHDAEERVVVHGLCPCSPVENGVDGSSMRNRGRKRS